jgi:hypothetical protein
VPADDWEEDSGVADLSGTKRTRQQANDDIERATAAEVQRRNVELERQVKELTARVEKQAEEILRLKRKTKS